jgi:hypothetical protein
VVLHATTRGHGVLNVIQGQVHEWIRLDQGRQATGPLWRRCVPNFGLQTGTVQILHINFATATIFASIWSLWGLSDFGNGCSVGVNVCNLADGGSKGSFCPVGCSAVGKDRGFSTRLMWREDGAMVTYAYYPDKPSSIRCGEDWMWSKKVQAGKWHHIRMYAKLNTVSGGDAQSDGVFKAWLDGEQVLDRTGIRYRYNEKFLISRAYMTTYCGGSSRALFAPKQDQYIWCVPSPFHVCLK